MVVSGVFTTDMCKERLPKISCFCLHRFLGYPKEIITIIIVAEVSPDL